MTVADSVPRRGEVWPADFDPVHGPEQGGRRPALVVSTDEFNTAPSRLVALVPLTTRDRGLRIHVCIAPPEGNVVRPSAILCDQLRILSQERLQRRLGRVPPTTLDKVGTIVRRILDL